MGRGRQKAKQRKVARDLKYFTPDTDYQALERELRATKRTENADQSTEDDDDYYEVPPAIDDWDDYTDDDSPRPNRRR